MGKKENSIQAIIDGRKVRRSLGMARTEALPRCGHWDKRTAEKLAAEGDPTHLEAGHVCELCSCKKTAGHGTSDSKRIGRHYGIGWCSYHEKYHSNKDCQARVDGMTQAIREGYPARTFRYRSTKDALEKIQHDADNAKELLSLRENQLLVINLVQQFITAFETGVRDKDGLGITESSKNGPVLASDITILDMLNKYLKTAAQLAKVELDISSSEFCHLDEVKVFFGEIMRIVQSVVGDDDMKAVMDQVKTLKQPKTGKKR